MPDNSELNLNKLIDLPIRIFKFLAIDFNSNTSKCVKNFKKILVCLNIFHYCTEAFLNNTFFYLDEELDMGKIIFGTSIGATLLMVLVRYFIICVNQTELKEIMAKLSGNFSKDEVTSVNIEVYFKRYQMFTKIYSWIMSSSMFFFCYVPFATFIMTGKRVLPFLFMFPFDVTQMAVYPLIMAWLSLVHLTYVLSCIANEIFLYGIITVLSIEFKLLRVKFESLDDNEEVNQNLIKCIERHNELLNISMTIERIFAPSFFCNFVMSSLVICFTALQASTSSDIFEVIFCGAFCIVTSANTIMQSIFGQLLKDSSNEVAVGIWNCKWERYKNLSSKRNILTLLMRVQKPVILTAMNFSEVNMEQFAGVILMHLQGVNK